MESFLDCAEHRFVYAPPTTMYCAEVNIETPFKDMLPVPTILLIFPRDVKKKKQSLFFSKIPVIFLSLTAQIAHVVFKQNFGAMVLSQAYVAMGLHADSIRNTFDGCPVTC